MGLGSFVVAHFADPEGLLPAVSLLTQRDDVVQWNAVEGNAQLIVKLRPSPPSAISDLKLAMPGTPDVTRLEILSDFTKGGENDPSLRSAYVFIESEPRKSKDIWKFLQQSEAVQSCFSVNSGSEFIACVQGRTFDTIDKLVNTSIRTLDGLIRLKVNRIIELRAM